MSGSPESRAGRREIDIDISLAIFILYILFSARERKRAKSLTGGTSSKNERIGRNL